LKFEDLCIKIFIVARSKKFGLATGWIKPGTLVATAMWPNSLGSLCFPEFGKARWHSDASHTSHCRCLDHTCLAARSASSGLFFEKSSSCHQLSISRTEALSICLGQLMKLKTSETHCKLEVLGKGAQSGAQSGSVGPA
jgi:hypothetical protein